MYQYDVETFMSACDRKGLAAKTRKSYEQTLRLFGLFLAERGITQTEEIRHPHIEAYIDTASLPGHFKVQRVPRQRYHADIAGHRDALRRMSGRDGERPEPTEIIYHSSRGNYQRQKGTLRFLFRADRQGTQTVAAI